MSHKDNRRLVDLTADEFVTLFRSSCMPKAVEELMYALMETGKMKNEIHDIISIRKVAVLTSLKRSTIYAKVRKGEIPVLSRGKPLRFSRREIEGWMRGG